MVLGKSSCRCARAGLLALLALTCTTSPATAKPPARPGGGDLSPRLAELARPSVRSAPPTRLARELSLARRGPGSLLQEGNRVLVQVRFEHGAVAGIDDLRAAGAKVVEVNPRYQRVTVAARPDQLRRLAQVPRVAAATEALAPATYAVTPCFGAATSEGDLQLRAAHAREEFGVDGSGVTVGILSDSFDLDATAPTVAAEDVLSGDLPGGGNPCEREDSVDVLDDTEAKGEDEGRAMAQIVHDLAPGATLAFATAFKKTVFGFAENIRKLAEPTSSGGAGATVIVDDVSYFEEPFFQEGPVGVAVQEVSEDGVAYFSAAGNNNLIREGRDITSWEAPEFRDAATCPTGVPGFAQDCMDFDPGAGVDVAFGITVAGGATLNVDLQWAQPWEEVTTDFDSYLLNPSNQVVAVAQNFNVTATQMPFEFFSWTNPSSSPQTMRLAINRCSSPGCDPDNGGDEATPRLKFALLQNGGGVQSTEYESSSEGDVVGPTIFGHSGAREAVSVGAIRHDTDQEPEYFSSRGPVTHYFAPADGVAPATELPSPEILEKPDLVATDGTANTFFGSCTLGPWRFFGTSAAAPHAAAVAALQRQAQPSASPAEIGEAQRDSAVAVGSFPPGPAVGAGMLDAVKAIEGLGLTPTPAGAPETPPTPVPCLESEPEEPETNPGSQPPPQPGGGSDGPGPSGDDDGRKAPQTLFRLRPPKVLRTAEQSAQATFKFGANQGGVVFLCKFDRSPYRRCKPRTVRRFGLGRHVVRVKARNAAGLTDASPAVFRFRVERVASPG